MRQQAHFVAAIAGLALAVSPVAWAKITPEEAAQLGLTGTPLTPVGAERAGNADGTIPEWTGGIQQPPANFVPGEAWVDPFPDDKPLFTITAQNYAQYQDNLTAGQVAMFQQYPDSFRMHVYPTRRSASFPDWVYEATQRQALHAELCPGWDTNGNVCLQNHVDGGGYPFPIPKNAFEVGWNHYVAYQGQAIEGLMNAPLIDTFGNRVDVIGQQWQSWMWWVPAAERPASDWFHRSGGPLLCDAFQVRQPPRQSGLIAGGCNYAQEFDFQAYLYVPGQRRVRKAPEIGFQDSPSFASDGQRTVSSRWQWWFAGKESRHALTLNGKTERFMPYNSYALAQEDASFDVLFGPKHVNPDLVRYELRRVWELEATVKPGHRHLYKRIVAYIDEDTWHGLGHDAYDARDRLWRMGEGYILNLYDTRSHVIWGDQLVDMVNGRYTTFFGWYGNVGAGQPKVGLLKDSTIDPEIFTPQGLRKFGIR
ncbi:MAG TPA: DUF1329 domain-containing protein [Gammaproteobacteria bacterium]|nr:DUF1329 domain-containing protein [Gammaproteobacteria bacterium]